MKRIFSGIQPSGNLQLGNYLGAIRNWARMQKDYECIFCVVDLHALTLPKEPGEVREGTLRLAQMLLAIGLDPKFPNMPSWPGSSTASPGWAGSIG